MKVILSPRDKVIIDSDDTTTVHTTPDDQGDLWYYYCTLSKQSIEDMIADLEHDIENLQLILAVLEKREIDETT